MLRKQSKLMLVMIVVIFMFSFIGNASAITLLDQITGDEVQTDAAYKNAAYKLKQLGIIEGYPDGSFGVDKTISRAEFAKIVVHMAGMQSVADDVTKTPSCFQDIKTADWFNGFVNITAAQGYMKGEPNGNFRPSDNINEAEVVTVLLRILGYNDNLSREWPSDYISKAANLGILYNITFVSCKDITRGKVFILCTATLEQNVVQYNAISNTFENAIKVEADIIENGDQEKEVPYTLLQKKIQNDHRERTVEIITKTE
ncbi:MAG: S-layer homology domain-containing protein [Bacillota bacterium]|nr:S-layer homology domain-containing protein [Bacillota bacterium]